MKKDGTIRKEAPEDIEDGRTLNLFDMNPAGLHDLFKDFDDAMKQQEPLSFIRLAVRGNWHERRC